MKIEYSGPEFPELEQQTMKGMRWYKVPSGDYYPSITSVLSKRPDKQKGLKEWREKVGDAQANIISGKAARRGNVFHSCVEDFIQEKDLAPLKEKNFLAFCMFQEVKPLLEEKIKKVVLMEQTMYSPRFQLAGRCDFIGVWDGKLAVVDWKTTTRPKKEEWIDDYFVQATAYASMYTEFTGELIEDVVIVMVAEDGQVEVFEKKVSDYMPKLDSMMAEFYKYNFDIGEEN
jgi:genome maintenance exonuclease 1